MGDKMTDNAEKFHKKAVDLTKDLKDGNYEDKSELIDEIIVNFEMSLDLDSRNYKTWMDRGDFYFYLRYFDKSLMCCEKVIELNPKSLSGWKNKVLNLKLLNRTSEALGCCSDAIAIFPNEPSFYFEKSMIQRSRGNYEKALRQCNNALKLDPKNPLYNFQKGLIFGDLEEYRMGAESFRTALKYVPEGEEYNKFRDGCVEYIEIFENKSKSHIKKTKTQVLYDNGQMRKEGMTLNGTKMVRGSFPPIYFPSQKDNMYQVEDLESLKNK